MSAGIRVVETMNQGLAVHNQFHLLARWCKGFNHEECHVFCMHRRAGVVLKDSHAGNPGVAIGCIRAHGTSRNGQLVIIDALAGAIAKEGPGGVPRKIRRLRILTVNVEGEGGKCRGGGERDDEASSRLLQP
jgi:hypothetical protein